MGKGIVSLVNGGKAKAVLFVDGMNHNLLYVSHICDQGYDVLFRFKSYQINYESKYEVIDEVVRTNNNRQRKFREMLSN